MKCVQLSSSKEIVRVLDEVAADVVELGAKYVSKAEYKESDGAKDHADNIRMEKSRNGNGQSRKADKRRQIAAKRGMDWVGPPIIAKRG